MSSHSKPPIVFYMLEDVDRFLTLSNYSEATSATYAYHLHRFAMWLYERQIETAGEITDTILIAYLKSQMWKQNTQRAAGNAAKTFLRWRFGADHPAAKIKLPKDNAAPGRYLDQEQLEALLALFDTTKPYGWRNLAMISLMVETGMRISEICRLEIMHVDLKKRHLDVIAKNQKWREGVFTELTAMCIDVWLNARNRYALPGVRTVFVSVNGKTKGAKLTPSGMRANFRRMGLRADIGRLSPHDLRRTMAMLLTAQGAPSRLVQELGAWDDIRMVERYTRRLRPSQIDQYSPIIRSMDLS